VTFPARSLIDESSREPFSRAKERPRSHRGVLFYGQSTSAASDPPLRGSLFCLGVVFVCVLCVGGYKERSGTFWKRQRSAKATAEGSSIASYRATIQKTKRPLADKSPSSVENGYIEGTGSWTNEASHRLCFLGPPNDPTGNRDSKIRLWSGLCRIAICLDLLTTQSQRTLPL